MVLSVSNLLSPITVKAETILAVDYIKKYEKFIISACRKTGVFPSIMLGQLIYESGGKLSDLAIVNNNMFGIKWAEKYKELYPGSYPVEYWTSEYGQGTMGTFASFPSVEDCIIEKSRIWWNGMYEDSVLPVLYDLNSTPEDVATAIGNSAYQTTGSSYGVYLYNIIQEWGFEEYDKKAFPEGRKLVGYADRIEGEYNYPDDGYNSSDVESSGTTVKNEYGGTNIIVEEKDLVGMYPESSLSEYFNPLKLPSVGDLSTAEAVNIVSIRNMIAEENAWSMYDNARVFLVFVGLCVLVYAMLFLVAYMFDRVNTILDISLLGFISLGRLRYSEEVGGTTCIDRGRLIKLEIVMILVGLFLVSGGIFSLLVDVLYRLI